jgi:hypothetical protein
VQLYAELLNPGDHIDGAEVLWVQLLHDQGAVLIALDAAGPHRGGRATDVRRYRAEELVEVDDEPPARRDEAGKG